MEIFDSVLKKEEQILYMLREIFRKYGFTQFKMSKFEEYELYARNKDFLVGDGILTFTDTNGRLMALKPDVTLSIAKNSVDEDGVVQKVYYNENVYRISKGTHAFKEIMQTGVECIGDISTYNVCEVITLAAKSLALISENYVMDISHMGIVRGLTGALGLSDEQEAEILACIGEKNLHEATKICRDNGISEEMTKKLSLLISTYGNMNAVLKTAKNLVVNDEMKRAYDELCCICDFCVSAGLEDKVHFDFSIVNNMSYYNGVLFQGFISGVASEVLAGGRYDNLMAKMGKKSGAIGFAVYLDALERLDGDEKPFDVDVVMTYASGEKLEDIDRAVKRYTENGLCVSVQKKVPAKLSYRELARLENGEVKIIARND